MGGDTKQFFIFMFAVLAANLVTYWVMRKVCEMDELKQLNGNGE